MTIGRGDDGQRIPGRPRSVVTSPGWRPRHPVRVEELRPKIDARPPRGRAMVQLPGGDMQLGSLVLMVVLACALYAPVLAQVDSPANDPDPATAGSPEAGGPS